MVKNEVREARKERKASRVDSEANAIVQTRPRARQAPTAPAGQQSLLGDSQLREDVPAAKRPSTSGATGSSAAASDAVPDEIRRRFVQIGKAYYFPDGARAFTDRGRKLTTPSENTEVVRSLVAIAQARGWEEITVSGTERFRKEAWTAARLAGLATRGYAASEFEREQLVRTLARRSEAAATEHGPVAGLNAVHEPEEGGRDARRGGRNPGQEESERGDALVTGRLIDHGPATYRHDPRQAMSYFAKLETDHGERTIWGVDLERAFKESLTRPQAGDEIGLRSVRRDAVTVRTEKRDAEGRPAGIEELATHRNRWIVEKRAFFEARAEAASAVRNPTLAPRDAVAKRPELAGTYLYLRGAEEIATKRIRDPEDQKKFVALVRSALADAVERGEPLPAVRLRERRPDRTAEREPTPTR